MTGASLPECALVLIAYRERPGYSCLKTLSLLEFEEMTTNSDLISARLTLDWDGGSEGILATDFVEGRRPEEGELHLVLKNCEALFERRPDGYAQLRQLHPAVDDWTCKRDGRRALCHFNAFAYSFLAGAKNFDFLIPRETSPVFVENMDVFRSRLRNLERFEQLGDDFPTGLDKDSYFALRSIFTRAGARDERWVLAELILSGPNDAAGLARVLSTSEGLVDRILRQFTAMDVVVLGEDFACVADDALVLAYFFVRETMGVDPLEALQVSQ